MSPARAGIAPRPGADRPRIRQILSLLAREYPDAACALRFSSPLELLVATVLSAQCTDARVNLVTAALFARYRTAADYAAATQAEMEAAVRSTGFFRNKARAIRTLCAALVERHGGEVPRTMEALVDLPGVGRKTANLVLAEAFGVPGLVVDTHVGRLSRRLGLTRSNDPERVEEDLARVIPKDQWNHFSLRLIHHGRQVCKARRPLCHGCALRLCCPVGLEST